MKTRLFLKPTLLSCLLSLFVFGDLAMAGPLTEVATILITGPIAREARRTSDFTQFVTDSQKLCELLTIEKFEADKLDTRTLEEAKTILNRLNKHLQQISENDNDLEALDAVEIFRANKPFGGMRIYLPERDPRYKVFNQIFEQIDQIDSLVSKIDRKLLKKKLNEIETKNMPELEETSKISNKIGVKLVADFYATSNNDNVAISPPNMVSTYAALAHIAKGKTKEELQKLLSLEGNEKLAFDLLHRYLSNTIARYEPDRPFGYASGGHLIIKSDAGNINNIARKELSMNDQGPSATQKEFLETYRTLFMLADLSGAEGKETNAWIAQTFHQHLLEHASSFFPGFTFVTELFIQQQMGTALNNVYEVVRTDKDTSLIVRSIAGSMDTLPDREMKEDDEPFMGEPLPFKFDSGTKNIDFFKIEVKEHQTVTVNGQSGYRFPLGVTDLTMVRCADGTALKQLAKTITSDGLQIEQGRKVSQPTMLYLPQVDFDTVFDIQKYANDKGFATPFTKGAAEFSLGSEGDLAGIYCSDAKIECTFMVDCYGIIAWQQIVPEAAVRAYPMGRNDRLPNNIYIDSPYLMLLTDRKLGTVLGMAFIANPEQSEARKKHDRGFVGTIGSSSNNPPVSPQGQSPVVPPPTPQTQHSQPVQQPHRSIPKAAEPNRFQPTAAEQAEIDRFLAHEHSQFFRGDVKAVNGSGYTLLHMGIVVFGGGGKTWDVAVAKYLVSKGADVNAKEKQVNQQFNLGRTPLHLAAQYGHIEATKFLVSQGADVNATNSVGQTPLDIARQIPSPERSLVASYLESVGGRSGK